MRDELDRLEDAFAPLLAQDGPGRLVAFALACAAFVLPLWEASGPHDLCLRHALRRDPRAVDVQRAQLVADTAWFAQPEGVFQAAAAVIKAIHMAFDVQTGRFQDATLVYQALCCMQSAECAVAYALESGSAQERLDLLGRMEGHTSFHVLLASWLLEPSPRWQSRLAERTRDVA